ncbi:tetratricopeptide repeat protein [Algoriphagus sp. H41]|uniref:Tetratricopeptide repeat protein n=1 Tax=Algoriphagus oliviformis TaxID=2811231 RepID=A0ABS3BZS0_9BACT|nr:tetratricopeptide repeat protein [Algoriphagus oliviformis]MBN7809894.1 tetratricopeptide repeat protein [Algoriphagus oliviformis]
MKIKSTLLGLGALLLSGLVQAQDGWNWPADPAQEAKARELNAAYVDYMKSEQFVEATKPLNWLLVNTPELNESIYINGVTVYKGAADKTTDEAKKGVYQDSVMSVYVKRGELYDNEAKWIENKAYYGYLFYKSDKDKIPGAIEDFEKAIEMNGNINHQLVGAYFDLIYRNNAYNKAYTGEQVLAKYEMANGLLNKSEAEGKDVTSSRNLLEQVLVNMELIDCDFIENTMGPKLAADPTNEELANQIFKYSVQYKCFSSNSFLSALELIDSKKPTFATSQVRAMRYMASGDFDKAQPVLEKALTLAENNKQKGEIHMELAKVHAQAGRKSQARTSAKEAAAMDAELTASAYGLIGDLYMSAFNDCKSGESRAKDYSIFIAAYGAYQKAGDSKGMGNARARFPSKEELFTEGLQVGSSISTGCWVGETVTLATRD